MKNQKLKIRILKKKSTKNLFEKNERYFIQGHVRMHTAKRKNSKVKIACRRADLLKWPYFRTSAILTVTFDLQTFVWDKNSRKVKTEPHIYLLRGFQNAQEIENRSKIGKNTEEGSFDSPQVVKVLKKPRVLRVNNKSMAAEFPTLVWNILNGHRWRLICALELCLCIFAYSIMHGLIHHYLI